MTNRSMCILALAAVTSLPLLAQQPASNPQPQTGSSPQVTTQQPAPQPQSGNSTAEPVPSTANSPEIGNAELRPIPGELVSKLDTKNAKTGDPVVIKTTEKATTSTGIEIPKGSKIVGRVTDVEAKGTSSDNSRVTIQFDQAELKGGQNLPIRSVIQSIAPAANGSSADAMGGAPAAAPAGGSPSSGGAVSGNGGSASSGSTPSTGSTPSASSSPTQSGAAQSGPPQAGMIVARNGNVAIRTTSIPGVFLAGNANGQPFSNAAGALLGAKQDVHLDGGTMMVVAIIQAPPSATGR
jgi:hypothetical protein